MINHISKKILISIFCIFLVTFYANAGTITLNIRATVKKVKMNVKMIVEVTNSGDDMAKNVMPIAFIENSKFNFQSKQIPPGKTITFVSEKYFDKLNSMKSGTYPIAFQVRYTDSDNVQHYAPAYGILKTANKYLPNPFDAKINPITLNDSIDVTVSIHNTVDNNMRFIASLHTTPKIKISPSKIDCILGKNDKTNILFKLTNNGDQSGSVKPLHLFLEFDDVLFHSTKIYSVPLTISNGKNRALLFHQNNKSHFKLALGACVFLLLAGVSISLFILLRDKQK